MKKMLLAPLVVCMVALVSVLLMPAVHATPPTTAEGKWTYVPTIINERKADGNTFKYGEETATWSGTFVGTSYDVFVVVVHPSGLATCPYGLINFVGTVNGKEGTLVINFVGQKPGSIWYGQWVIISGTGELANLRGQGTWWGPPLKMDYSGDIHFD